MSQSALAAAVMIWSAATMAEKPAEPGLQPIVVPASYTAADSPASRSLDRLPPALPLVGVTPVGDNFVSPGAVVATGRVAAPPPHSLPLVALPPELPPSTDGAWQAFRPLVAAAPLPSSLVVGRGILGQPKLYVPHQPLRNALRYLTP